MKFQIFSAAFLLDNKGAWEKYGKVLEEMAQGYYEEETDTIYATFDTLDHLLRVADALGYNLYMDTLFGRRDAWIKDSYME